MAEQVHVHEPYVDAGQQREADMLGMYIFLATEIMLFGGLFAAIFVLRYQHAHDAVEASRQMHVWLGAVNTAILLTSSLLVAVAVHLAEAGSRRGTVLCLGAAAILGLGFLGLKAIEYSKEYADRLLPIANADPAFANPTERLFMNIYLVSTGLHAAHVAIGIVLLAGLSVRIAMGRLALPGRSIAVEVPALYWHLVDIVWIFLYPSLYLVR